MNKERLLKIADYLEKGQLLHKNFDFAILNDIGVNEDFDSKGCGTSGCAVGEFPGIFPEDWYFSENNHIKYDLNAPRLINSEVEKDLKFLSTGRNSFTFYDVEKYLDIDEDESGLLFVPGYDIVRPNQNSIYLQEHLGNLSMLATKDDVAKHIRKFVELKEKM